MVISKFLFHAISMFVVYDKQTKCIQNWGNMFMGKLEIVPISYLVLIKFDQSYKNLILDLTTLYFNEQIECYNTVCNKFLCVETCIDCGNKPALWISKYLITIIKS